MSMKSAFSSFVKDLKVSFTVMFKNSKNFQADIKKELKIGENEKTEKSDQPVKEVDSGVVPNDDQLADYSDEEETTEEKTQEKSESDSGEKLENGTTEESENIQQETTEPEPTEPKENEPEAVEPEPQNTEPEAQISEPVAENPVSEVVQEVDAKNDEEPKDISTDKVDSK